MSATNTHTKLPRLSPRMVTSTPKVWRSTCRLAAAPPFAVTGEIHPSQFDASVFRGIEGFGASSRIHTTRILSLSEDLPLAIVIVDTPEHLAAFLPQLDELITEGLVILDDVQVVKYVGRGHEDAPSGVG